MSTTPRTIPAYDLHHDLYPGLALVMGEATYPIGSVKTQPTTYLLAIRDTRGILIREVSRYDMVTVVDGPPTR